MSGGEEQARLAARTHREARIIELEIANGQLQRRVRELERERDELRRGVLGLYHNELITMSRARELMGFKHIDPVREMYRRLKPEFEAEGGKANG